MKEIAIVLKEQQLQPVVSIEDIIMVCVDYSKIKFEI